MENPVAAIVYWFLAPSPAPETAVSPFPVSSCTFCVELLLQCSVSYGKHNRIRIIRLVKWEGHTLKDFRVSHPAGPSAANELP